MDRTIVVGVDQSAASKCALSWAARYARRHAVRIAAVHVLTYSTEFARDLSFAGLTSWRRDLRRRLEGSWTEALHDIDVPSRTHLLEDDTIELGLVGIADRLEAELIVLGAPGHRSLTDRLMGSVVDRVTHRANRPVVIVPVGWPRAEDEDDTTSRRPGDHSDGRSMATVVDPAGSTDLTSSR
jgi:nucleotide-binding universal stress UspA family protein